MTVSEFIDSGTPVILRKRGYDLYMIDGRVAVDKIYRYEDMNKALADITAVLKLPRMPVLPRAKSSTRTDRRHYREILNEEEGEKIGQLFKKEIALLGYEY